MDDQSAQLLGMGIIAAALLLFFVIGIAINIFICFVLSKCFERVPMQYRQQSPGMVWLLLIPCFNLIWNFFVHPKLAASYKAYFNSIGRQDVGDCGAGLALAYSILMACAIVPYLGGLAALAGIVVLIIWLIKANELKNQIPTDASQASMTPVT